MLSWKSPVIWLMFLVCLYPSVSATSFSASTTTPSSFSREVNRTLVFIISNTGNSSVIDMNITLPAGFDYISGSASLLNNSNFSSISSPTIKLRWSNATASGFLANGSGINVSFGINAPFVNNDTPHVFNVATWDAFYGFNQTNVTVNVTSVDTDSVFSDFDLYFPNETVMVSGRLMPGVGNINVTINVTAEDESFVYHSNWTLSEPSGDVHYSLYVNFSQKQTYKLKAGPGPSKSRFITFFLGEKNNITANVSLLSPPSGSVFQTNNVTVAFNVTGASQSYFCLLYVNMSSSASSFHNSTSGETTVTVHEGFFPAPSPPIWSVQNNTNSSIYGILPNGWYKWNVKCAPKSSYTILRNSSGFVILGGQKLDGIRVGDIINFTNNLSQAINITFYGRYGMPNHIFMVPANGHVIVDTSPDFTAERPPLAGNFSDDLGNTSYMGREGKSYVDPVRTRGSFASQNLTLLVNGTFGQAFDPSQYFNSTQGFIFQTGPCSNLTDPSRPQYCNQTVGGVQFDPNNQTFFEQVSQFAFHGFTDCSKKENENTTDCRLVKDPSSSFFDNQTPNIVFIDTVEFSDMLFFNLATDEYTNASVDFFGIDSYCGGAVATIRSEGVRYGGGFVPNSQYKPFHHIELRNVTVNISTNTTYYYKINVEDRKGNAASSACRNVTAGWKSLASNVMNITFVPPPLASMKLFFSNGTSINITGSLTNFQSTRDAIWRFENETNKWNIDFKVDITVSSDIDMSSSIKSNSTNFTYTGHSFGGTFVGMNHTVWETLYQRFGVEEINVTIPYYGTDLWKCDDDGQNCINVTALAHKANANETANTTTWTISGTLGFSTFVVSIAIPAASPSSPSSSGGSGGSFSVSFPSASSPKEPQPSVTVAKGLATISLPSVKAGKKVSVTIQKTEDIFFSSLSFVPLSDSRNAKITVKTVDDVEQPDEPAFAYVEIERENLPNVRDVAIEFKVEKKWLEANGLGADDVHLRRLSGSWETLPTKRLHSTDDGIYYEAYSPSFSLFAIAAKARTTTTVIPTAELIKPSPGAGLPLQPLVFLLVIVALLAAIKARESMRIKMPK